MYKYQTVIRLHQTDAAGVVFFANFFVLAHDCYESFLENEMPLGSVLEEGKFILPIVHTEADYLGPVKVSQTVDIEMTLNKLGARSFELGYVFKDQDDKVLANLATVHVFLNKEPQEPEEMPDSLKEMLEKLR